MNETPGARISDSRKTKCATCQADVLLGLVRDETSTLRWHNFELPAIERGAHRYYRRHICASKTAEREQRYSSRLVGAR